jgi:hypothetical protein
MGINQALGFLDCLAVVGANQRLWTRLTSQADCKTDDAKPVALRLPID